MASLTQLCVQLQSLVTDEKRDLSKIGGDFLEAYSKLPAMAYVNNVVNARKEWESFNAGTKERASAQEKLNIALRLLATEAARHPSVKAGVKQAEQAVKAAIANGIVKSV